MNHEVKNKNHIFTFFNNGVKTGSVFFLWGKDKYILSYSVVKEFRGQGLGTKNLQEAIKEMMRLSPGIKVSASVITSNYESIKILQNNHFLLISEDELSLEFMKSLN